MKFSAHKSTLLSCLQRAAVAADHKSAIPALSCIALEIIGDDTLRASATDLYRSAVAVCTVNVETGGAVIVDARNIVDRVKGMPNGDLTVEVNKDEITIRSRGARSFRIIGAPFDDYPKIATADAGPSLATMTERELCDLIDAAVDAVSEDITRAYVNSLQLEVEPGQIMAVATDGHRLHRAIKTHDVQVMASLLVPLSGIQVIRRTLDDSSDAKVELAVNGGTLFVHVDSATIGVKLCDAAFPPYKQVIPKPSDDAFLVPRSALLDSVSSVGSLAKNGVKFGLSVGKLKVSASEAGVGDGEDELECEYAGKPISIGSNHHYLADALRAMRTDEVLVQVTGELDPIVIREPDGDARLCVVMPMRV